MNRATLALRTFSIGLAAAALVACGGAAAPTATTKAAPTAAEAATAATTTAVTSTAASQATSTFTSPLSFSSPLNTDSPIPTPTYEVFATSGVVFGQITALPQGWLRATVWLAPFTPVSEDGKTGFYVLEPSVHPYTDMLPNGYFQFTSVPPGKYVIIAGPTPEEALPAKENGDSRVVEVKAGEVLDVGQFSLP
ncbi:MAG: hypothetical protein ACYC5O_06170 [Anaerolineae bacterium]